MPVVSYSPDAHPETTTVDGHTVDAGSSFNWATLRNQNGSTVEDSDTVSFAWVTGGGAGPVWKSLRRAYILFNVNLPGGSTITSARVRLYVAGKNNQLGNVGIVIVPSNPQSNTALVASDHNIARWTFTAYSNVLLVNDITTGAYNNWTLNATGIAALTNGVVKLGVILEEDRTNTQPTSSGDNQDSGINFQSADNSNPPILEITYDAPGVSPSASRSPSASLSPSASVSSSTSPSASVSPSSSVSPSASRSPSASVSPSISPSSSVSPSISPSVSPSSSYSASVSPSASVSASPSPITYDREPLAVNSYTREPLSNAGVD